MKVEHLAVNVVRIRILNDLFANLLLISCIQLQVPYVTVVLRIRTDII